MSASTLAEALVAFQAELPTVTKSETAKVETAKGSYSYTYAGLADITETVMPLLTKHGLAFTAGPTIDSEGRFVLRWSLLHTSGEREDGAYPLPTGTPQQVGSAITYARRYSLCAATGVVPDDDDDGQAAQHATYERADRDRVEAEVFTPHPSGPRLCAECSQPLDGAVEPLGSGRYRHKGGCPEVAA